MPCANQKNGLKIAVITVILKFLNQKNKKREGKWTNKNFYIKNKKQNVDKYN